MVKTISFLFLALILFTGNGKAAFMTNVDDGSFEFRLDIRHMGSYVTYAKLDLFFQDFARLNEAIVFDDITMTSVGQMFVLTESDGNFSASTAFLTKGLPDWIIVSLTTPTRDSYIEGTEPDALFGDPSGDSGIDFAGWSIKSIKLLVTDLVFIYGFDPSQGAYTNIAVQGVVTIEYGGSPFDDVPLGYWAEEFINKIYEAGITSGCSQNPPMYCPEDAVTRAQMAVFLERGINGSDHDPPGATGIFDDCPVSHWAADWVEQFYNDGITSGCSTNPLMYCPDDLVTRAQMAVFLLRSMNGKDYTPPSAEGIFDDVPVTHWASDWIEQLYDEGITGGCSTNPPLYCPDDVVNRAQMAVFIVRAFDL